MNVSDSDLVMGLATTVLLFARTLADQNIIDGKRVAADLRAFTANVRDKETNTTTKIFTDQLADFLEVSPPPKGPPPLTLIRGGKK